MQKILFVHAGTEQYGSDKSFVAAVAAMVGSTQCDPVILLPGTGPIDKLIKKAKLVRPHTRHLWVLRKANFMHEFTFYFPRNLIALWRAINDLRRFDMVYVNTVVIFDFLLAAAITRRKIVVHVRELPIGIILKLLRALLISTNAHIIFNSFATQKTFNLPKHMAQSVVYNGFEIPAFKQKPLKETITVLCIGRLNAWKGQHLLIKACALLNPNVIDRLRVRIVGGVYDKQVHFREQLVDYIAQYNLHNVVSLHDFTDDPGAEYQQAEVVVVPSTLPEPFGRVAIEGMAYGCAIVATNHGGLPEIVVNDETGWLVLPGSVAALRDALEAAVLTPGETRARGERGRLRFNKLFTQEVSDKALVAALTGFRTH
jgi:glycosyltransferase involved in cell wall biosynthesis